MSGPGEEPGQKKSDEWFSRPSDGFLGGRAHGTGVVAATDPWRHQVENDGSEQGKEAEWGGAVFGT
jgi:hypothetical protein